MTTYYVSTNGNDANDGGILTPFATFAYAQSVASSGDTIYMRGGTYTEQLTITKALTTAAYESEPVIILPAANGRASAALIQADNVTFNGLTIDADNRWRGVDVAASYTTLDSCTVRNCVGKVAGQFGQGITVTDSDACHHTTIINPTIHNVTSTTSDDQTFCHGIYSARTSTIISGGEYYAIGGYAVHYYSSHGDVTGDATISNLYIHDSYGGIGAFTGSVLAYNNVIRVVALALVTRYAVVDAQFYFNTIVDAGSATDASALADGASVLFQSNVYYSSGFATHWEQLTPSTAVVISNHNLRSGYTYPDYQGGYASAWVNTYINGTFAPIYDNGASVIKALEGNPAIGAGVFVDSAARDMDGQRRPTDPTLGAYEFAPVRVVSAMAGSMGLSRSVMKTRNA